MLHPRRRHVVFGGITASGSSESNSSGFVSACAVGCGGAAAAGLGSRGASSVAIGFGGGTFSSAFESAGSGSGVSSTSECLPVVHGGIERNSSKVRTRGLQHFQPGEGV